MQCHTTSHVWTKDGVMKAGRYHKNLRSAEQSQKKKSGKPAPQRDRLPFEVGCLSGKYFFLTEALFRLSWVIRGAI